MPKLSSFLVTLASRITPRQQVKYLLEEANFKNWESFRDSLVRRWTNLNVVCGLIMGAVSTILFSDFEISRTAFALAVVSLLSSLISIGFGVGLIYVLGDVVGSRLHAIGVLHTRLYIFALSIPQAWAAASFTAFFTCTCVLFWEATNKGWLVRAGVVAAIIVLASHMLGFAYLFQHDNTEYLIPTPYWPTNSFPGKGPVASNTGPPIEMEFASSGSIVPKASEGLDPGIART